jgi:GT2 family glycosyltransferase
MNLSIVAPFRSDHGPRAMLWHWNMARWSLLLPGVHIYTGSGGDGPFNRSAAINQAAERTHTHLLLIVDSDTTLNAGTVESALYIINENAWLLPYKRYYNLTRDCTSGITSQLPGIDNIDERTISYEHCITSPPEGGYQDPVSGAILIRREDFLDIGGFNEDFEGWGYEDREFQARADYLLGGHGRVNAPVFHLWHPASEQTTWSQPLINRNKELYESILGDIHAGNLQASRR